LGTALYGVIALLIVASIPAVLMLGAEWMSSILLPWFSLASAIVFTLLILVVVPLSVFRGMRRFAAVTSVLGSYLFGSTLWMFGLLSTITLVGWWAVFLGLIFMGFGVIPIAMLAMAIKGLWGLLGQMLALLAAAIGAQVYSAWIEDKYVD